MTKLRDKLAAAALQGMLAHSTRYQPRLGRPRFRPNGQSVLWHHAIAEEAYELADAMLHQRKLRK